MTQFMRQVNLPVNKLPMNIYISPQVHSNFNFFTPR